VVTRPAAPTVAGLLLTLAVAPAGAVVNGTTVDPSRYTREFPWMVALLEPKSGQVCGATRVSPTWVVTAGHCTNPGLIAFLGHPERGKARQLPVAEVIVHPQFKQAGRYDVGLARLPEAVPGPVLPVATLLESRRLLGAGGPAVIVGWGRRGAAGGFSEQLAAAQVQLGRVQLQDTMFRTQDLHAGVCHGDSGGPLVIQDTGARRLLVGIASVTDGDLCAKGGGIAGYTEVAQVRDFILTHVTDLPGK
jgi:suppressor of tumorigenicity protein 14